MPLNLRKGGDGDFNDILRFDARSGELSADGKVLIDVQLAFDFYNIRVGWIAFFEGQGPERIWDPVGSEAPKPTSSDRFKRGFEVMVWGKDIGLREILNNSAAFRGVIIDMHSHWEDEAPNGGEFIPLYKYIGKDAVTSGKFRNYKPVFSFEKWIERSKIPSFGSVNILMNPAIEKAIEQENEEIKQNSLEDDIPF